MGAPRGNTNALKNGLYSRHLSREQQGRLRKMSFEDFRHEMVALRIFFDTLLEDFLISKRERDQAISAGKPLDFDTPVRLSNAASTIAVAYASLSRTQALFSGRDQSKQDALDRALDQLIFFQNDDYLRERNQDVDARPDITVERSGPSVGQESTFLPLFQPPEDE